MGSKRPTIHAVIPDCQVKPGVPLEHLSWIGQYLADKRPDVIVCIGDFADMPSLSSYDRGKRTHALMTYAEDIQAAHRGMKRLMDPIRAAKGYRPRLVMTLGNHEDRITRAINEDGRLHGTIALEDLRYKEAGWEVYPFLTPVIVDGIAYCHYFQTGVMGRPASSAKALVKTRHMSATMGHVQRSDVDLGELRADGKQIIGLFAGVAYLHDEPFLGQANAVRRQIVMCYEVDDGSYDPAFISLSFLRRKYGRGRAA